MYDFRCENHRIENSILTLTMQTKQGTDFVSLLYITQILMKK